jgi:hypothetical protein
MTALSSIPRNAASHFQLHFYGAALRLREHAPEDLHPFLHDYCADPDAAGLGQPAAWDEAVEAWERDGALPLQRLAHAAGLDRTALHVLFLVGLVDEDARFGTIFEQYTAHPRPTAGLLHSWWPRARPGLRRLAVPRVRGSPSSGSSRRPTPTRRVRTRRYGCPRWRGTRSAARRRGASHPGHGTGRGRRSPSSAI